MKEQNTFERDDFVPALLLGFLKQNGETVGSKIAVAPLNYDLKITPTSVAAMMIGVYECWERNFPEAEQIEFEKQTLDYFAKMFELRFGHTVKYYLKDE